MTKQKLITLFVESANKGHGKSQLMIGRFFLMVKLLIKIMKKALTLFQTCFKTKEYDANCYIAYMYSAGTGVFPNFGRAHMFCKR